MRTGMGTEIGKHPLEPMDFIPSYLYGDQLFKFIRFVDYIDPEPESCENPIEERHYLIEWETPNGSVLQWTHCENITDHRSGMQDMYEIVKSKFFCRMSSMATPELRQCVLRAFRRRCPCEFRREMPKHSASSGAHQESEEGEKRRSG